MPRRRRTAPASSPATGGRPTTTARRWFRSTPAWPKGWHVGIGDTIRVNVLGRDIDLTVASLRDIAWQSLSTQLLHGRQPRPAGACAAHPYRHRAGRPGRDQGALLRAVTDALPNVTGIRVADVLAAIAALLDQIAAALAATGSLTLVAGVLVLVGAVAAGPAPPHAEAVILKTLGATRAQIRAAWLVEFGAARPGRRV